MQEDENIIRIGSAGSYTDKAKLFDVVLATGAYSESNYAVTQSGDTDDIQTPSAALNDALRHERLDHDERFKQQVVARNRGKLVHCSGSGASNRGGPPSLPCNRGVAAIARSTSRRAQLCDR